MITVVEIILIIANAALFAGLVSVNGLLYTAVGLIFEVAVMWLVSRTAHRRPRAGWLTLTATLGIIAGAMRYPGEMSPETIAALIMTVIVHGSIVLMLSEFLSNQR